MNPLKKLAGQTAVYGLSSMIARFLNYLLVPLHTLTFTTDQFGIITEMYSYVAFLIILLAYGMETSFFRFSNQQDGNESNVFKTVLSSLFTTTSIFIAIAILFSQPIAEWLMYPNNDEFVIWFAIIVGLDAISSIPQAKLRIENKSVKFVFVNFANVGINIGLNFFFLKYCKDVYNSGDTNWLADALYNPELGVSYVFISNLVASCVKFLMLTPMMFSTDGKLDLSLLKQILKYSTPLLVAGLAGMVNEAIDKLMLKRMLFDDLGEKKTMAEIGIYGACYKLSIIITLFIQAFRYAADPFFFSQEKEKDAKKVYAEVMNYFVIVCAFIFLIVTLYMDQFRRFIPNEDFWVGLKVVPILLMANICLGIYYNLSFWYKLLGKTSFGLYIALFGATITLVLNYVWIPEYSYLGSAWATLICYFSMVCVSYLLGQKYYPINYDLKRLLFYVALSLILYLISTQYLIESPYMKFGVHTLYLLVFIVFVYLLDVRKKLHHSTETIEK